ncbi:hypothetical protein EPO05_00390 [Patescibacteria group bacterium]|nr:MAG: hypothetical protein EPO05_00390 [Patescibacteria group bacterium]
MTSEFEKNQFEQNLLAEKELEKINIVEEKLVDKYKKYEELKSFVIYLSAMERIFTQFRIFESTPTVIKEEIIKTETYLFSQDVALDESVFHSIRDDFSSVYLTVSQICDIAEKLLQKFGDNEDCQNFIKSLRDISLILVEAQKEHFSIDAIQERVCRSKMNALCADGDPELVVLENIYVEFKAEIEKIRNIPV